MNILSKIQKKWVYGLVAIVAIAGIWFFFFRNQTSNGQTLVAHAGDFVQQVSVSGTVVPVENLDLSFSQTDQVKRVNVKVGDSVHVGDLLASQDVSQLAAQLAEMQAGIDLQTAKLNQSLAGALPQDIQVSQDAVTAAQQDVTNAYQNALVSLNGAYTATYNAYAEVVYIQNTYFTQSDQQSLKVQDSRTSISNALTDIKNYLDGAKIDQSHTATDAAVSVVVGDLNTVYTALVDVRDQCDQGIYYARVSTADKSALDTQKANINTALATLVSSQHDISSKTVALQKSQSQLDATKAGPRDTDIAVFKAQIAQAQASAQNIRAQIYNRQIVAPFAGVVTQVNAKVGSVLGPTTPAVSLMSSGAFQLESYVPEIYVALVKIGDEAAVTFDAYGSRQFEAKVISIDPGQTVKDGVATYKTTLVLGNTDANIKTGMSSNIVITTEKKSNVISVPQGVVTIKNGQAFVNVEKGKETVMQPVVTGEFSSSGSVEIVSGLHEGDVVIVK